MEKEPEQLIKEYNCPYKMSDPRCATWLEGYREGYKQGADKGLEALRGVFKK